MASDPYHFGRVFLPKYGYDPNHEHIMTLFTKYYDIMQHIIDYENVVPNDIVEYLFAHFKNSKDKTIPFSLKDNELDVIIIIGAMVDLIIENIYPAYKKFCKNCNDAKIKQICLTKHTTCHQILNRLAELSDITFSQNVLVFFHYHPQWMTYYKYVIEYFVSYRFQHDNMESDAISWLYLIPHLTIDHPIIIRYFYGLVVNNFIIRDVMVLYLQTRYFRDHNTYTVYQRKCLIHLMLKCAEKMIEFKITITNADFKKFLNIIELVRSYNTHSTRTMFLNENPRHCYKIYLQNFTPTEKEIFACTFRKTKEESKKFTPDECYDYFLAMLV